MFVKALYSTECLYQCNLLTLKQKQSIKYDAWLIMRKQFDVQNFEKKTKRDEFTKSFWPSGKVQRNAVNKNIQSRDYKDPFTANCRSSSREFTTLVFPRPALLSATMLIASPASWLNIQVKAGGIWSGTGVTPSMKQILTLINCYLAILLNKLWKMQIKEFIKFSIYSVT